jgi:hypothetical protein
MVAEAGTDWARHGDAYRERFPRMITLLQEQGEPPQDFARRVRARLASLGSVGAITLLCSEPGVRGSVACRRGIVDACLLALEGVPGRELTLVLAGNGHAVPHWLTSLGDTIERHDPGLAFAVEFDSEAAAA